MIYETVYAIVDRDTGEYATYGPSEFKKELRFARLYKSKETALRHYFSKNGKYNRLNLQKILIEVLSEEVIEPKDFKENRGD